MGSTGLRWTYTVAERKAIYKKRMITWRSKDRSMSAKTKRKIRAARRRQSLAGRAPESNEYIKAKIAGSMIELRKIVPPHNSGSRGYKNKGSFVSGGSSWNSGLVMDDPSPKLGTVLPKEIRTKISRTLRRKFASGELETKSPIYQWYTYKDVHFRSSWDAAFAKWLDSVGELWHYEPRRFRFSHKSVVGSYTPDFYLPRQRLYVEVKGVVLARRFGDNLRAMTKEYPQTEIVVLRQQDLVRLGVLNSLGQVEEEYQCEKL